MQLPAGLFDPPNYAAVRSCIRHADLKLPVHTLDNRVLDRALDAA
jgi:hypothetical protein